MSVLLQVGLQVFQLLSPSLGSTTLFRAGFMLGEVNKELFKTHSAATEEKAQGLCYVVA